MNVCILASVQPSPAQSAKKDKSHADRHADPGNLLGDVSSTEYPSNLRYPLLASRTARVMFLKSNISKWTISNMDKVSVGH